LLPPTLLVGFARAKLILPLPPRLFFTAPPFVALLVRQTRLTLIAEIPAAVILAPAILVRGATLGVIILTIPLATLIVLLLGAALFL